jgi:hypothetical protein
MALDPSAHVVVDDIGPNQIARAQHVESCRHLGAVEIAFGLHRALDCGNLILVYENFQIAAISEIHLRGEEGDGLNTMVAFLRHQRQGGGQKRSAYAIAD